MNKLITIFALLVIVIAVTEANSPKCSPKCHKGQASAIKCVRRTSGCRKMKQCSIDEENCRRRLQNKKPLRVTSSSRCRNIKGALGSGQCAKKPVRKQRNVRPDCRRMKCTDHSKKLNCYRSPKGNCRLRTPCQVARSNCRRAQNNRLSWVTEHQCHGMKGGDKKRKCHRQPHKSG